MFRRLAALLIAPGLFAALACEMQPEPLPVRHSPAASAGRSAPVGRAASALSALSAPAPAPRITLERVRAVARKLEAIRALKFKREVPAVFLTGAELRPRLEALFDADYPPEKLARESRLLKALALIPPDADLRALYLKLLSAQVAGLYDPQRKVLYVVTDANLEGGDAGALGALGGAFDPLDIILVHELDHALADQYHDLEGMMKGVATDDDAEAALQCLVEGEATLAMVQFTLRETLGANGADGAGLDEKSLLATVAGNLTPEMLTGLNENDPALKTIPRFLVERLEAPYLHGLRWALGVWQDGGWAAIEKAYEAPPRATRDFLHPGTHAAAAGQLPPLPPRAKQIDAGRFGALDAALLYAAWGAGKPGEAWARDGGDALWRVSEGPAGARFELLLTGDGAGGEALLALIRAKLPAATVTRRDARRVMVSVPIEHRAPGPGAGLK